MTTTMRHASYSTRGNGFIFPPRLLLILAMLLSLVLIGLTALRPNPSNTVRCALAVYDAGHAAISGGQAFDLAALMQSVPGCLGFRLGFESALADLTLRSVGHASSSATNALKKDPMAPGRPGSITLDGARAGATKISGKFFDEIFVPGPDVDQIEVVIRSEVVGQELTVDLYRHNTWERMATAELIMMDDGSYISFINNLALDELPGAGARLFQLQLNRLQFWANELKGNVRLTFNMVTEDSRTRYGANFNSFCAAFGMTRCGQWDAEKIIKPEVLH